MTIALKYVLTERLVAVYVALIAPLMSLNPIDAELVEACHCIVPVYPVSVSVVEFVPIQTIALAPETIPPIEVGLIKMESTELISERQTLFVTIALKKVLADKFVARYVDAVAPIILLNPAVAELVEACH